MSTDIKNLFYYQGDEGGACGLDCNSLLDDDIKDDYICARRIYRAHQNLQGNGFSAWAVFAPHCSGGRAHLEAKFTNDCFNSTTRTAAVPQPEAQKAQLVHQPYAWFYAHHQPTYLPYVPYYKK
jgi:C-type lysozyme/alpha-lactalbumin family